MLQFWNNLSGLIPDRRAVTALEYAFIAGVVAIVMVVGAGSLGLSLSTDFVNVAGKL